ncbi:hypothetical protein HIM_00764 [Hirsutella minnesotensis 3608]|nr:hypothetical protein HIM_00764 [Hirsutella minnesotensis 3608]
MARPSLHLLLLALIGYALAAALPATTPCADIGSACTCEGTTPDAETAPTCRPSASPTSSGRCRPRACPFNYYVYRVAKPFEVAAGPIAPWFEQPGGGVQFKLSKSVGDYIKSGYLERVAASCQSNAAKCEVLKSR